MTVNRLDNEFGAFLKAQELWKEDPDVSGRLEVRVGIPLKDKVDPAKLQGRLDRIAEFEFEPVFSEYLKLQDLDPAFLEFLETAAVPHPRVLARENDVMVRVDGRRSDLPLWEVPIANQLHDLFFATMIAEQNLDGDVLVMEGVRRFQHKADLLRGSSVAFAEAGTRWRYSYDWYDLMIKVILGDLPNLITGTTNPWFALGHGLKVTNNQGIPRLSAPSVKEIEASSDDPVVVSETNAYEMAHLHSHFGNRLIFEWGSDLTSDMGPGGIPLPLTFETKDRT